MWKISKLCVPNKSALAAPDDQDEQWTMDHAKAPSKDRRVVGQLPMSCLV